MPRKVQIVIEIDESKGTAAVNKIGSAITNMGGKVRTFGVEGTRSMQTFTNQGLLKAVLGANLLEQAVTSLARNFKDATFGSTLLAARSDVLDTVMVQLAKTTGGSVQVLRAQQNEMQVLGVDTIRAQEALVKFTTAQLSTADAVKIANVARNRAQITGEDTSATMERFTRAILAQEVELLKLAGITVRQEEAFKLYAVTIGKASKDLNELERRQAFVNEILRQARNDTGLYESAWEKAGKRLLSIPRLARQAGIALGREFQNELAFGVDAILRFLKFAEDNGAALALLTKEVVILTGAYVALRIAMSETILVNVAAFFSGMLPHIARAGGAITTLRLLLMGAGGTGGAVGAYGLLGVAAAAAGLAIGELGAFFVTQSILAEASAFNFDKWRAALHAVGIETKNLAEAKTILARVGFANQRLVKRGLPTLRVNANLLDQLRQAEDNLRIPMEANTQAIADRAKALAKAEAELNKSRDRAIESLLQFVRRDLEGMDKLIDNRAQELNQIETFLAKHPDLRHLAKDAELAVEARFQRQVLELERAGEAESREGRARAAAERIAARQAVVDQIAAIERQAAVAGLDAFEQIEFERLERIERIGGNVNASFEQIERARVAINRAASAEILRENDRIADEQTRQMDRQAREYDRLLDRMVRFTEQTGSVLNNIWRSLADEFKRSVTKMALSWLLGMRTIQGGARGAAAGGGLLATLLGLGGPLAGGALGGTAAGATPPFIPAQFVNSFAGGAGPFNGGGAQTGSGTFHIPGAVPTAPAGSRGGPLGGLLGALGLGGPGAGFGAGGVSGGGLGAVLGLLLGGEGIRRGSPLFAGLGAVGGVLGGVAGAGAAAGVAGGVGALSGLGVGLAAFLTNPVGLALLGGITAFSVIGSILSRGGKKEQATTIANQGFERIDQVMQAFRLRQTDYLSAIEGMNSQWEQMVAGWNRIGGSVGRNSIADQRRWFNLRTQELDSIQAERLRRETQIGGLPLPHFEVGGLVPGQGGRPLLAAVHPGEFVMRRQAVDQIGAPRLRRLNEGGAAGDTFVVNIATPDKHGVQELLDGNEELFRRRITRIIRRDVGDGGPIGRMLQ